MDKIFQEINRIFLENENININSLFQEKGYKAGEYILKPGEHAYCLFFIEEGITRNFLFQEEKEITLQFNFQNEIAFPLNSFDTKQKSDEYIQALSDTIVSKVSLSEFNDFKKNNPEMLELEVKFLEFYISSLSKRLRDFQTLNATQRYLKLLKTEPNITKHCKLTHIASYLGISLVSLSRIRSSVF